MGLFVDLLLGRWPGTTSWPVALYLLSVGDPGPPVLVEIHFSAVRRGVTSDAQAHKYNREHKVPRFSSYSVRLVLTCSSLCLFQEAGGSSQQLHGWERSKDHRNLQWIEREGQVSNMVYSTDVVGTLRSPVTLNMLGLFYGVLLPEYGTWRHLLCCRTGSTVLRSRQKSCGRNTLSFWRNTKSAAAARTSRSVSGRAERWRSADHRRTGCGTGFRFFFKFFNRRRATNRRFLSFCVFVNTSCVSDWTGASRYSRSAEYVTWCDCRPQCVHKPLRAWWTVSVMSAGTWYLPSLTLISVCDASCRAHREQWMRLIRFRQDKLLRCQNASMATETWIKCLLAHGENAP